MALPARVTLSAYRGDTWNQELRLKEGDDPVDLTGATVECWAQMINRAPQAMTIVIPDPTTGEILLSQPSGGLPVGKYRFDLQVTGADSKVTTWIEGQLVVAQDVTHAV